MRRSTHTPIALVFVLLVAVFVVLFADVLAVSAAADPLSAGSGAVLTPGSPPPCLPALLPQLVPAHQPAP